MNYKIFTSPCVLDDTNINLYKIEETKKRILSNFLWKLTGCITGILWAVAIMLGAYAAGL